MYREVIINFLTKDMHLQKDPIDYDYLYNLALGGQILASDASLTPKNREKVERKLRYLSELDEEVYYDYHIIDTYSLSLLKNKFGLQTKLKNKILFENKIYRFIFDFYYYKHGIDYDQFIAIDNNYELLADNLDINLDLVLEKDSSTLEEMSQRYGYTRESIRLRIKDTKKFVTSRLQLPKRDYILDSAFDKLDRIDQIILLSYYDTTWDDNFKAFIISKDIRTKLRRFETEIEHLKDDYTYEINLIPNQILTLGQNYVKNDTNLYIDGRKIYSLVKGGEHHNANYILNYLKDSSITEFYIEDLLHDKFLKTVHGTLMAKSITTTLRNLEAILDREDELVKIDTHYYKLESSINYITYLDWEVIFEKLRDTEDGINLEKIEVIFASELELLTITPTAFYYLLKKHLSDKFQFRKLVIYNNDYKLQTKFEILLERFDKEKIITLDDSLLTNATNLSRKFYDRGGIIYGNKLYNTRLLTLSKTLREIKLPLDFDNVVYRNSFNIAIDDIVLNEIDFKRKFAFKLWAYIHGYHYNNFYAQKTNKYPELHLLVYAINDKKKIITYKNFIDIIEQISGSRKVYQILQNMIESGMIDCRERNDEKIIYFKEEVTNNQLFDNTSALLESITVSDDLHKMTIVELRKIAKNAHVKNINTYKKDELISILANTIKLDN